MVPSVYTYAKRSSCHVSWKGEFMLLNARFGAKDVLWDGILEKHGCTHGTGLDSDMDLSLSIVGIAFFNDKLELILP